MTELPQSLPRLVDDPTDWRGRLTKGLLLCSAAFAPWAFGTTQTWAIVVLNLSGTALGLLWLLNRLLPAAPRSPDLSRPTHWTTTTLGWLTASILAYNLIAAANAQSTFDVASRAFQPLPHIPWLPHSYDRTASWLACWQAFALAGTFWATRSWLLSTRPNQPGGVLSQHSGLLPAPARRLLFFIVTNGLLLAVVALLQRLDNTGKLLWLVQPRINNFAVAQFGPFAYRSNGLQYLGLIWPVGLALWSMLSHARRAETPLGTGRRGWLLICALTMAACPFLWESRMAVAVNLGAVVVAAAVLLASHPATRQRLILTGGIVFAVGIALALNWHGLAERLSKSGFQSGERLILLRAGSAMFRDHWLFGTGPGSFPSLYLLYRPNAHAVWETQLHCDWLQTLVTYGVSGFLLIATAFVVLFLAPLDRSKLPVRKSFLVLFNIGLISALLHATVDFPFQVYAIQHLFVLLAACYSALSLRD